MTNIQNYRQFNQIQNRMFFDQQCRSNHRKTAPSIQREHSEKQLEKQLETANEIKSENDILENFNFEEIAAIINPSKPASFEDL